MARCKFCGKEHHIGFVSTRFAGTDGVSLETEKWAAVFEKLGFNCFYYAGELDRPSEISYLAKEAHFQHPEIKEIFRHCFGVSKRRRSVTQKIQKCKQKIKDHLYQFIRKYHIELLIPENVLALPLNLPLGMAIAEVVSETEISTIAHHHDFYWERQPLLRNAVSEYLNMAFPPHLPTIKHVVLNSSAENQLSLRTGISATIIPNVMDFENPPPPPDKYAADVRQALGIGENELFVLQPTRVVKRKGIEHAIELVRRLGMKAKLVISHASSDEGHDYEQRLKEYSKLLNVNTLFVSDIINEHRGRTRTGKKIYTLEDIYPHADLVTYPSDYEGFGNAFLEAIYFRKPILVNTYSIYTTDIKPKGFSVLEIDGYVTDKTVRQVKHLLRYPEGVKEMMECNYQIASRYYSYTVLHKNLKNLLSSRFSCVV